MVICLFGDGQEMALFHSYGIGGPETDLAHHLPETTSLLDHANNLLHELSGDWVFFWFLSLLLLLYLKESGKDLLLIQILPSFLFLDWSYLLGDSQLHSPLNHNIEIICPFLHLIYVFLGITMRILHPLCQFGH